MAAGTGAANAATSASASEPAAAAAPVAQVAAPAPAASADAVPTAGGAPATSTAGAPPTVTVVEGDSLWALAETHLGDGERYAAVLERNRGVVQADGGALGDDLWLTPGWVLVLPDDVQPPPAAAATATVPAADGGGPAAVVVEAGDTLWDLAEEGLGDGSRYAEVAALNGIADPDVIEVGAALRMPAGAVDGPAEDGPAEDGGQSEDDATGDAPEPEQTDDPVAAPPDDAGAAADPPVTAPAASASTTPSAAGPEAPAETAPIDLVDARTVGGLGGLLAAGLLGWLGVRRLQQRRDRGPGERVPAPDEEANGIERELRAVDDSVGMEHVDLATRTLARWAQDTGAALPAVYAVRLAVDELSLYLELPAELPPPFERVAADGAAWAVDPHVLEPLDRVPSAPYPALVTLGQDGGGAHLLVDLERLGALDVVGGERLVDGALAALAIELVTSSWCDDLQVTLVGIDPGLPRALDTGRLRHLDDVDALLRNLRGQAADTRAALDELGAASLDAARGDGPDAQSWMPEIVLVGGPLADDERRALVELATATPRLGIAAVGAGPLGGAWTLDLVSSASAGLDLPGGAGRIPIEPQIVTARDRARLARLAASATLPPVAPDRRPDDGTGAEARTGRRDTLGPVEPSAPVGEPESEAPRPGAPDLPGAAVRAGRPEDDWADPLDADAAALVARLETAPWVRLLGPVALQGAAGEPPRTPRSDAINNSSANRATELVAFMTLNPGATAVQVHAAFWPGRDPQGKSAASNRNGLATRTRKWLGSTPTGEPYFPHVGTGGYRLHPDVTADWLVFRALVGDDPGAVAGPRLRAALDLVAGQPIGAVKDRYYGWAEVARMEMLALVGDACHEAASRAIDRGDLATARSAAALGREVDPVNETCWRDAMRAELAAGDRDGFDRLVTLLTRQLDEFEDGYEPEFETQRLIDEARESQHA